MHSVGSSYTVIIIISEHLPLLHQVILHMRRRMCSITSSLLFIYVYTHTHAHTSVDLCWRMQGQRNVPCIWSRYGEVCNSSQCPREFVLHLRKVLSQARYRNDTKTGINGQKLVQLCKTTEVQCT